MSQEKPPIFKPKLNPALHRHGAEAAIIGRIVVGFGELEYLFVNCATLFYDDTLLKALYRTRSTASRIDSADALIEPRLSGSKLYAFYREMLTSLRYCSSIRNQYAHCNFADHPEGGLFLTDLENFAKQPDNTGVRFLHVDAALLNSQEDFFVYTQDMLYYLRNAIFYRNNPARGQPYPIPALRKQPPLYNPPNKHIPPWFTEAEKVQHLEWAAARGGSKPTPTFSQKKFDAERAAKRVKLAENRRKSAEGEARAKSSKGGRG